MRTLLNWLPVLLLPLLAGCFPGIYAEQPLGEVAVLKPEVLNGSWLGREGRLLTLSVIDANEGILVLRAHTCAPAPPALTGGIMQMRRFAGKEPEAGRVYFPLEGSVDAQGRFTPGQSPPLRYEQLILLMPAEILFYRFAEERLEALVEQGALPGRIDNGYVVLGRLGAEHLKAVSRGAPAPVHWQSPEAVLVKLPPELDPCGTGEHGR